MASFVSSLGRRQSPQSTTPPSGDTSAVAQINAIADPQTAKALQNLQKLLYTQELTEDEYQAAKDRLFRPQARTDSFAQIEKLAELHRAGILGDIEFSAAKAKVLGF